MPPAPTFRLRRRPLDLDYRPVPDDAQQAVVDHAGGPLLVVAGPGTGKTTTLVEAVVARVERGVDPERILVLTFGRKAAAELRERITARLGRTVREPLARTFHSYAFGVLRREAARRGELPPRLLSGPEQDLMIRELLQGDLAGEGGSRVARWPADLRPALPTQGFAQELRDLLMRCNERGVDPRALDSLGRKHGRPDWRAAARFFRQYADVSALAEPAAYDPSELLRALVDQLLDPSDDLRERERAAYDWVFVDEYQDTDPAQEQLLLEIVPTGGNLVVVGDPNQSIYAFRGADVRCIRRFRTTFRTRDGRRAPEVRLLTSRRSAPAVLAAGEAVARRMRGGQARERLRGLPGRDDGRVDVLVAGGASQEAALVAGVLRRAHVVDGVPWSRMAVLLRSTRSQLAVLRRAMTTAGVPVGVAADELPVADQPGVRPIRDVLRAALRPETLDEDSAVALLTGPVGRLDPVALRRLRRELRHLDLAAGSRRPSGELLIDVVRSGEDVAMLTDGVGPAVARVAGLLREARDAAAAPGATAETVLWRIWERSGLAARWQAASLAGGARRAAADRDLDAVMALFATAARFVDRLPRAGAEVFLDHLLGQEIPGDSLAARAPGGEFVRILTAHAAKGLEWDLVVVAGLQEGVWPDLRVRGSLLGSEQLVDLLAVGDAVARSPVAALLEEERRLFYVAVTRGRERLVLTASSDSDEGEQPSRFLAEVPLPDDDAAEVLAFSGTGARQPDADTSLGTLRRTLPVPLLLPKLWAVMSDARQPAATRARAEQLRAAVRELTRSLDLASLVAELRAAVTDGKASDETRTEAARQLARLAAGGVPGADPDEWYGLPPLSDDRPLRDPGTQVRVSPSRVEAFTTCQLRWLLESVGGSGADSASQSVGTLVHALAAASADPALRESDALLAELDERWQRIDLGSPWFTEQQRERAAGMLRQFLRWLASNNRELLGVERDFRVELDAPLPDDSGSVTAVVAGRVDRLERDEQGRGVVVDLKTGTRKPKDDELASHAQLGVYQLAVELLGFADSGREQNRAPDADSDGGAAQALTVSGGASLVQVGKAAGTSPKEQRQPPLSEHDDPEWARRLVATVAAGMAGSAFLALENEHCDRCPVRTSCPLHEAGRQVVA